MVIAKKIGLAFAILGASMNAGCDGADAITSYFEQMADNTKTQAEREIAEAEKRIREERELKEELELQKHILYVPENISLSWQRLLNRIHNEKEDSHWDPIDWNYLQDDVLNGEGVNNRWNAPELDVWTWHDTDETDGIDTGFYLRLRYRNGTTVVKKAPGIRDLDYFIRHDNERAEKQALEAKI